MTGLLLPLPYRPAVPHTLDMPAAEKSTEKPVVSADAQWGTLLPSTTPEILCIGESMVAVVPEDGRGLAATGKVRLATAGAESNVAHHLADQGFATAWVSAVGMDPLGDRIIAELRESGIDVRWVDRRSGTCTGVLFKDPMAGSTRVYYYRSGSAASRLSPQDIDRWPLSTARWVHLTGITAALSPSCGALVDNLFDRCDELGVPVSFDVNYRPALWAEDCRERLRELAQRAHVVLVGLDEAEALWGTTTANAVARLVSRPSLLVVKDSAREAVEFDRRLPPDVEVTRVPARRVEVLEPVGAGDAFAGGYLGALLRGDPAAERLEAGHSLAAWTLGTSLDYRRGHGHRALPPGERW